MPTRSPDTRTRPSLAAMDVDGRNIRYLDNGIGEPVILVHCSSATHREWLGTIQALGEGYRTLAPDLIGYGKSDLWPDGVAFNPNADVELVRALVDRAGAPVHLVGHSYGGAIALEVARVAGDAIRTVTLIEPVTFHVLREAGRDVEWKEVRGIAESVRSRVDRGDLAGAAGIYMSYWIGRIRWWLMPRRQKASIVRTVTKVAHEFGMIGGTTIALDAYRAIASPVRLIAGSRTRATARAAVDVLSAALPNAHVRVVEGAGHMSPFTHADAVSALVVEHVTRGER
ncbi:MAG: alpha/beta fold hydrolase [Cytophagaceae bacterium]|nr:alpha/beta fold hydrolase [Gemmatimonadaceae bacterium]